MAFEELKQRQSVMWGNGPYQRITETIVDIHDIVLERLAPQAGDSWLDLACGTGAVAERAAAAGADGHGDRPRARPDRDRAASGPASSASRSTTRVGDAEQLDVPRRELRQALVDVRDHVRARPRGGRRRARARDEARRPDRARATGPRPAAWRRCSPSWRRTSRRRRPRARSPGATRRASRELLGETFELELEEHVSTLRVPSGEDYWELFSTSYGPTKTLAEGARGPARGPPPRLGRVLRDQLQRERRDRAHARVPARSRHAAVEEGIAAPARDRGGQRSNSPPARRGARHGLPPGGPGEGNRTKRKPQGRR